MEKEKLSLVRELLKNIILIGFLEKGFSVIIFEKNYQTVKCSNNQTNSTADQ